jgi:hypothetical protein
LPNSTSGTTSAPALGVNDSDRATTVLKGIVGKRLTLSAD